MKNLQRGFAIPIIIAIVALLAVGGGVYVFTNKEVVESIDKDTDEVIDVTELASTTKINKNIPETTTKVAEPVVSENKEKNTPVQNIAVVNNTTGNNLWVVFDKLNEALKNKDAAAFNKISYVQVTPAQAGQFSQMADYLYNENQKIVKTNFINKWQDDKQGIYSTNPVKDDDSTSYGYTQAQITFINDNGAWKVLKLSPAKGWSISKSGTSMTSTEAEKELQAMTVDIDKDGLNDEDEICTGASKYDPSCVKTDPNKRDTNNNGLWDGIEADMM